MGQVHKRLLRILALTGLMVAMYVSFSSSLFAQQSAEDN